MLTNKTQLLQFFSSPHKQTTFYTCGPAVVRMIAEYYETLDVNKSSIFGDINKAIFNLESELFLTKLFDTTEEHGTDALYIAKKLQEMGCYVEYEQVQTNDEELIESFPFRLKNLLEEGIPIIVNYTYHLNKNDYDNNHATIGHFGIVYRITDNEIFISDPAAHFGFNDGSEKMAISAFLKDWKSGSGIEGIFLIIYPNERLYKKYGNSSK